MTTARLASGRPRFSRKFRLTLRRCLTLYGVMLAAALAVLAILCYQRWHLQDMWFGMAASVDVERFLFPIMMFAALAWQWFFFDGALCHGVSRRSYMKVSAAGGGIAALAVSVVVVAVRRALMIGGVGASSGHGVDDPFHAPLSERFLYAWRSEWYEAVGEKGVIAHGPEYSGMLPAGTLFMFLGFLSLMLACVALGMALGALLAWIGGKGTVALGCSVVVLWMIGNGVLQLTISERMPWLAGLNETGSPFNRLVQLIGGQLAAYPGQGRTIYTYVVWIPLVASLVLFGLCAWGAYLLTRRRELHAARQRLI